MDAREPSSASGNTLKSASIAAGDNAVRSTIAQDTANMTDPRRHAGGDEDEEEEEGMLKVDEEGQIEDDSADQKKAGSGSISNTSNNGYVSPRHANLDRERERDRDRYGETSPGPSSGSSYAPPSRSRFGYPSDSAAPYGSSAAYPYPPNHREPLRIEPPFASGSRTSFSTTAPRGENRRGWYPLSTPTTRGPDTYRPGAVRERERERERDWDSFRDGDRDREWSAMDRDRERDSYRDVVDKRRDWPPRERPAGASSYDLADTYPASASASSKYGFDNRDFNARRPSSPPAHLARDRDFDADRSRDRDRDRHTERDPWARAPSSGWGSGGMRQWGKPSDAGWDSRSGRRPASDDARSDTSHHQTGSRSINTPPPAASSEAGAKPIGSDNASERSEAQSRDLSPHPARSRQRDGSSDGAAEAPATKATEDAQQAQKAEEVAEEQQNTDAEAKQEKEVDQGEAKSQPAGAEAGRAEDADKPEAPAADAAAERSQHEPAEHVQSVEAPAPANEDTSAETLPTADSAEDSNQVPAISGPTKASAVEAKEKEEVDAAHPTPKSETQPAAAPAAEEAQSPTESSASAQGEAPKGAAVEPPMVEAKSTVDERKQAEEGQAPITAATATDFARAKAEEPGQEVQAAPSKVVEAAASAGVSADSSEQADEAIPSQNEPTAQDQSRNGHAVPPQPAATLAEDAQPANVSISVTDEAKALAVNDTVAAEAPPADAKSADLKTQENTSYTAQPEDSEPSKDAVADVDMPDAVSEQAAVPKETADMDVDEPEPAAGPAGPAGAVIAPTTQLEEHPKAVEATEPVSAGTVAEVPVAATTADAMEPAAQETQPAETGKAMSVEVTHDKQKPAVQAQQEEPVTMELQESPAPTTTTEAVQTVETTSVDRNEAEDQAAKDEAHRTESIVKMEEDLAASSSDAAKVHVEAEPVKVSAEQLATEAQTEHPPTAPIVEQPSTVVASAAKPPAEDANEPTDAPTQIQISGPHVTATIDKETKTREIALLQVDYGNDKQAQALIEQEDARIEEVEMPTEDQTGPALRIAEIDEATAKEIEPPLMTPTTKEQTDRAIHTAVLKHIAAGADAIDDWKRIVRENQRISQRTTMAVLKAKIHGIPQIVSSGKPLWLDQEDEETQRTKAQLFDQLTDRKKRLNEKVESLKKRYRSINEEWKLHCSRLDRIAERRELLRRPPVNTPAGTPGAFGVEDPSPGAGGGGMLGASLSTGRANRRREQAGFAGFGDAVRSEAEFLEILASLENADMQDPNMRAARTTATAPDMFIDPDSDHLMKLRYDDVNGFVADPVGFYLDEFDPDVWSEEEKAIFARRYALWPKQFGKIAQALPHKTPAQCVRYYYLNKKVPGNDFKALAAARNRERKRKARVKPKKAKGSALMADLKSAKGEEVDDVEDGSGVRSPMESTEPALVDAPVTGNGRGRGGRARMVPPSADGAAEEQTVGRKRTADQTDAEGNSTNAKAEKRKSGPKSKRAKSDSASATDKARKPRASLKKDSAPVEDGKSAGVPPVPAVPGSGPKLEAPDASVPSAAAVGMASADGAAATAAKVGVEDSDLAAAEALGALAGLFGGPASSDANASQLPAGSDASNVGDMSSDGRKAGKKRRSKTAAPGEEGADASGKGRGKQPTSSYWSVAERCEFLRALVVHGPRWEVVSSTLAQKSAAQARNYFARNEDEIDFAEAAALSRSHADLPLAEREAAALTFVRHRFASNSTGTGVLPTSSSGGALPPMAGQVPGYAEGPIGPRTTHLPPPPGITASQADMVDVKMREESPEPQIQRRGLQINSLLNDSNDAVSSHTKRRSSLHDWQAERDEAPHMGMGMGRDASVPPALSARQIPDFDRRPLTAGRLEAGRPLSSDGRTMRESLDERARMYERMETQHRAGDDGRQMREDGSADRRSWMYDSPYEAHRRPSPQPGYATMAPPSHPAERSMPPSRYSMPPSNVSGASHLGRPVPPMSSHLHHAEESDVERERERERERTYGMYGGVAGPGRGREHESHSMPPAVPGELRHSGSGEQVSPTNASFGSAHGYGRYAAPGVASMYPGPSAAASSSLASRSRPTSGPLTAPLPSTSERPAYEQRWQRYSQSPGPSAPSTAPSSAGAGGFSTASAYRSSNSPYSSFPSHSLPRPSLPSLSASGGPKVGAPHLPSLGAAGRSLPPILGSFPAPGRGLGAGARPGAGAGSGEEAARYWPYPHRHRTHDSQPPASGRSPE